MVGYTYDGDEYELTIEYYKKETGYITFGMNMFDEHIMLNNMTDDELKFNYVNLDKSYYNPDAKRAWKEIFENCIIIRRTDKIKQLKKNINEKR